MKLNVLDLWKVHVKDTFLILQETLDHQVREYTRPSRLYDVCGCPHLDIFEVLLS
jgi:hypothetical protein